MIGICFENSYNFFLLLLLLFLVLVVVVVVICLGPLVPLMLELSIIRFVIRNRAQ